MLRTRYLLNFLLRHSLLIFAAWPCLTPAQTNYPTRPIRFISPFAAGGSTTAVARAVGQRLTDSWGQQVIVDNRPGGNTLIGTDTLAKATPDGYTILMTSNTHVITPSLLPKLPYDTFKDFAPVCMVYRSEFVMVVNAALPAQTLQEFIALAKAKPGQINYATTGAGGSGHLANELFNMITGIKTQHIPYKGAGPALVDLIGGQVQTFTNNPLTVIPHIKSGRIRGLAVTGDARLPTLPQVPTFTEAGVVGLDVSPWFFVLAPAGTPQPILGKLEAEITRIVGMADFQEFLSRQGMNPHAGSAATLAKLMRADYEKYAKVIKMSNIKIEN